MLLGCPGCLGAAQRGLPRASAGGRKANRGGDPTLVLLVAMSVVLIVLGV